MTVLVYETRRDGSRSVLHSAEGTADAVRWCQGFLAARASDLTALDIAPSTPGQVGGIGPRVATVYRKRRGGRVQVRYTDEPAPPLSPELREAAEQVFAQNEAGLRWLAENGD